MEMKDVTEKLEQLGRLHQEFKDAHSKELQDMKKNVTAAGDRIEKTEKLNEEISKLQDEIKSIKAAATRSGGQGGDETPEQKTAKEVKQAYNDYLRGKKSANELKALNVEGNEDGGFLVTPEFSTEIVKKIYESSPMREICSVVTISSDQFEILEDLEQMESGWVTEQQARNSTANATFKKIMIPVHELYAQPKATQKVLDDAALNLESWISDKVSEKFARDEATAFVSGDGVSKPKGIISYGAGDGFGLIERINSGHASQITADGVIDLTYAIKPGYAANAKFLMKRATEKQVRKLKDSQNRYLWEPGLNGKTPATLLGFPIMQANDLEDVAANAQAMIFGDFKQGYQIVDRVGIRILRDVYSAKPYVLFYTTKRVGGGVKNFEALKILKIAA